MAIEVDPIEDKRDIEKMYRFMIKHGHVREAHLFIIGCNLALRISDLLKLTFEQLEGYKADLVEVKTQKNKTITFNQHVYNHAGLLKEWYKSQNINPTYLFESTSKSIRDIRPITRQWAHGKIKEAAEGVFIEYNVGTHTMRKTWGYHAFENGEPIEKIQKMLNHSSAFITLAYIGITKRKEAQAYHDNGIGVL